MNAVRILIADDHAIFRSGLAALLERVPEFEVVAETADGDATLARLRDTRVDAAILDLSMPGTPSLEVARSAMGENPALAVLVLTMHTEVEYLQAAMAAGVRGYVVKASASETLINAIRVLVAGGQYVDPEIAAKALVRRPVVAVVPAPTVEEALTPREVDVLSLLVLGHTNSEIGGKLFISDRTVETHRKNIQEKLGVKTRAELVRLALQRGLVRLS